MITKITRGSRVGDIAAYLHGPGKHNEHVLEDGRTPGGYVVASNLGANGDRDPAFWTSQLRAAHQQRPDIGKPIWQCSLRAAETDRVMSPQEWADIAQEFAQGMGFEDYPWVAVKHGPDHIHIVVSRVHEDPAEPVWLGRNDRWAAQKVRQGIEAAHGLYQAPTKSTATSKRVADHQLKGGEWRHAQTTGEAPVRVRLAAVVASAAAQSRGLGREAFEDALTAQGVGVRANVAATGRMNGYSFADTAAPDRDGQPIWFKASQLDKELSWAKLGPTLETPRELLPDRPSPGRGLLGREKKWDSPAQQSNAEHNWRRQVQAAGQGWQLIAPGQHLEQLERDPRASLGVWWASRHQEGSARAERAWKAARPPAWSDYDPELQNTMRLQAVSYDRYKARNEAMQREDTIRAAERGDAVAIAQLKEWVGPDVPERRIIGAARQHVVEVLQHDQQAVVDVDRLARTGQQPPLSASRTYTPPTPGRDHDQSHGRGR